MYFGPGEDGEAAKKNVDTKPFWFLFQLRFSFIFDRLRKVIVYCFLKKKFLPTTKAGERGWKHWESTVDLNAT